MPKHEPASSKAHHFLTQIESIPCPSTSKPFPRLFSRAAPRDPSGLSSYLTQKMSAKSKRIHHLSLHFVIFICNFTNSIIKSAKTPLFLRLVLTTWRRQWRRRGEGVSCGRSWLNRPLWQANFIDTPFNSLGQQLFPSKSVLLRYPHLLHTTSHFPAVRLRRSKNLSAHPGCPLAFALLVRKDPYPQPGSNMQGHAVGKGHQ